MDRSSTHDQPPHSRDRASGQLVTSASPPILAEAEVCRRMLLLSELQAALAALGVRSVLARNHRLVLRYGGGPCEPSGLTNPTLHILRPDCAAIATTDGGTYRLSSGQEYSADDSGATATAIQHPQRAAQRA